LTTKASQYIQKHISFIANYLFHGFWDSGILAAAGISQMGIINHKQGSNVAGLQLIILNITFSFTFIKKK